MKSILEQIGDIGIVPVIAINDVEKAVPLAKALVAGGIPCAEVTFRTAEGEEAIRRIAKEVPDILLGAGTVLTTEQVDRAMAAGAKFIVSPGFNPRVVKHCVDKGILITPGCSTPSDMEAAMEFGLNTLKFFPAEQSGGLAYLKAVSAPYPMLRFMPTGGINAKNLGDYLSFGKIVACGGSWMVKPELINAGKFGEITQLCREAVASMLDFSLLHVGLNTGTPDNAQAGADTLSRMFGLPQDQRQDSVFAGTIIELMKKPYFGEHGHIAIATNSVSRAVAMLRRQGVEFRDDTATYEADGRMKFIYLKEDVAGFALHLVLK